MSRIAFRPEHVRFKHRARVAVELAVKKRILEKPDLCERCNLPQEPCRDGRSRIQAHHHAGYDQPLNIRWLCVKCHAAEEPPLPLKTHCPVGHEYTPENTYISPSRQIDRRCRECARIRDRVRQPFRKVKNVS